MRSISFLAALGILASACAANSSSSSDTGTTTDSGGKSSSGGASSGGSGGKSSSGGASSGGSGGKSSSGGASSGGSGGKSNSGGASSGGSGGASQPGSIDCTDVSSDTFTIPDQYGWAQISLDNNPNKTYFFIANWWGSPYSGQSETINGLGFTIKSPSSTPSANNNPLGFPTLFIGTYGPKASQGSGLPRQVSSLTSIPTIFSTNADTKGVSNYNAAYDVWFTQSSALVTGSSPGPGGAYLMVWLFMPSDRRPRGTIRSAGSLVKGVSGAWDVWYDDSTNPPCVSYVSISKLSSLEFDLNNFIQDAVENNYGVKSSQYLSIIFAGFEVWGGGDGLQVKKFCANVK